MQKLMWSEPVSHNVFLYTFYCWIVCVTMLQRRTHKWNDPWFGMTDTYIYIYLFYIHIIYFILYILYIYFIYIILYIYILYIFVCCILKHLLNTDILVENGTCISNAVSVSSRKCSIWCCFSIVKYHF